jgi:branched-chain amino acid transport system substrate-binding protein
MGAETGPNASRDRHYAIELAVNEINAAGGVDGHRVEVTYYDAGFTPDGALTAVRKALSDKPTAIVGLAVTAQVKAVAGLLGSSKIPVLHVAQSDEADSGALGVQNLFRYGQTGYQATGAVVKYILDRHAPQRVGIIHSTDDSSAEAGREMAHALQTAGVQTVERAVPSNATDLTEAVLALKNTDVTINWSFPILDALFLKQRHQNGLTQPDYGENSGANVVFNGLASPDELRGYNYEISCAPDLLDTQVAKAYVTAYKSKYNVAATSYTLGPSYDAVKLLAAAVKQAGSTDSSAITGVLRSISYDGVCGRYKADANQNMWHRVMIVDASGGPSGQKLLKSYDDLPSTAK